MDIKVRNLTKVYGPQKAVDNISFDVKPGEILGFLGPNGAGKTTTMKMIAQYLDIEQGDILIGGKSLKDHSLKSEIGYLPESNPLYHEMPIIDYLEYVAALQGLSKDRTKERVREMIKVCGLDIEKHKLISELSKGYKQRVGLAQAMIHDPAILILDEPTTGLDPNQIIEIRELIKNLGRQKTVLFSTHILPEVEATCDRILIINKGKIVADGTATTLRQQAQGQDIYHVRIEDGPVEEVRNRIRSLASVESVDILDAGRHRFEVISKPNIPSNRDLFNLSVQHKWVITEMIPFETKLEDIFRDLTMN
ncbi:MAG: ATP-binding cassette domain-containing protein [Saprospiraceae bacterium]|jgi:ABC-2 type transport system ATP-binding protein|nr:ATP-binding cassette domain-containing protein [Saprospiraceae bacterium]MBK6481215.1 ATP-binding cassette domain-containing protein [Saprospiraceae bacterium]MBK7370845.1 ATP-binding cassette domain-containing protein [Saprospiraceae bacterium]MBK7436610.1 ATP-binding cassette domain-containing protein [Saprospiraceae bacterium]MBK7609341.1 ATP-binding cassette domain-containing protein [Saprospiraceae bacterium]